MRGSGTGSRLARTGVALATFALMTLALAAPPAHARIAASAPGSGDRAPARSAPVTTLERVGVRYVRSAIPIRGHATWAGSGRHRLVLQQRLGHRWVVRATKQVHSGSYRFAAREARKPTRLQFRTVLYAHRQRLDVSNVVTVRVHARPARPASFSQRRTVGVPYCPQLVVRTHVERRTVNWRWSYAQGAWVHDPTAWTVVAGTSGQRAAGAPDCVKIVSTVPAGAALPDLRIKDLTKCGKGDYDATGGTCFMIDPSAAYDADFPNLAGHKLLKFGVITLNVGAGPGEVVADRSATSATDWKAYQSFYDSHGTLLGSTVDPSVQFYFAGDGHNHWHVRDFDEYDLLDASGTTVAHAEKHGYCMQDNTTYSPMQGMAGVSTTPVYAESTSCGKGVPNALTIVHGLSRGWGDTYPTTLPDQAIDITGLADGVYTVRVHADAVGAVKESNENNNVTQVKVQISGNTVTVLPGTSSGGLP